MSDKKKRQRSSDGHRRSLEQLRKESGLNDTEEYAAESAAYGGPVQAPVEVRETSNRGMDYTGEETNEQSRWLGYTALAVSILSLFIFPFLFGATAVVLGFISFAQGNRALGAWSVILGILSMAGYFLLAPLYS